MLTGKNLLEYTNLFSPDKSEKIIYFVVSGKYRNLRTLKYQKKKKIKK